MDMHYQLQALLHNSGLDQDESPPAPLDFLASSAAVQRSTRASLSALQRIGVAKGGELGAIIKLGQGLNLEVIGKGVEQQSHLGFLREPGCRYGQGYLLSRPQPPPVDVLDQAPHLPAQDVCLTRTQLLPP